MKRHPLMQKYLICGLILLLISFSGAAVFGETEASKTEAPVENAIRVLTLEEAIEMAIDHSRRMKNNDLTIRQLDEIRERSVQVVLANSISPEMGFVADTAAKQTLLNLKQTEIDLDMLKMQQLIEEESIAFSVRQHFFEVQEVKQEIQVMEQALRHQENKARVRRLMFEYGMASRFEVDQQQLDTSAMAAQLDALESTLESAKSRLAFLMGLENLLEYTLEQLAVSTDEYQPELSAMSLFRLAANDPYVKIQERQVDKADLGLTLYTYSGFEEPYEVRRLSLEKEKNQLNTIKDNLRETVTERYHTLNQLMIQRQTLGIELEKLKAQQSNLALYFEVGMITRLDVEDLGNAVGQMELSLQKMGYQIEQLRTLFEKPYLAPQYLQ